MMEMVTWAFGQEQYAQKAKKRQESNSRKSVRWSAVPEPCLSRLCLKLKEKQGSGTEAVHDLCFHTYGEFAPSPPPPSLHLQMRFRPQGWDLGLRLKFGP